MRIRNKKPFHLIHSIAPNYPPLQEQSVPRQTAS